MEMDIKLDVDAAKEMVQRAMFEMLTEESREELVKKALATLMQRPPKAYGEPERQTPLEMAFSNSLQTIVYQVVREYLNDEQVMEGIRNQITVVLKEMVEDRGTWLYDEIGSAVGQSIKKVLEENKRW